MSKKYHIYKGHSYEEYCRKYQNKNYKVIDKVDADKRPELLENKSWWLINDKYYEVPEHKNAFVGWWINLGKFNKVLICVLCAGIIATSIAVPTAIASNQPKNLHYQ